MAAEPPTRSHAAIGTDSQRRWCFRTNTIGLPLRWRWMSGTRIQPVLESCVARTHMGLDGVELILAIEDGFQIHITDGEASAVTTVGNLHDLVVSRLEGQGSKRCLTSAAFYRTRRGIIEALGLPREDVRPSTALENILPENVRREQWRRSQDSMSLKLPDLRHPGTSVSTLLAIGMMLTIGPGLYAHVGVGGLALLSFLGLIMGALLVKFTPTLATAFPHRAATVGDLAEGCRCGQSWPSGRGDWRLEPQRGLGHPVPDHRDTDGCRT